MINRIMFCLLILCLPLSAEHGLSVQDLVRESREALASGQEERALQKASEAVALDPSAAAGWIQQAAVYYQLKNFSKAATAYRDALHLDPDRQALYRELARCQDAAGDHAAAISSMELYLQSAGEKDAGAMRDLARWQARAGELGKAIEMMDQSMSLEPDNAGAWKDLGLWTSRLHGIEKAIPALEKSFALSGKEERGFKLKIIADLADKKQAASAISLAGRWLKEKPGLALVEELRDNGRRHAANQVLIELWNADSANPELSLALAEARAQSGTYLGLTDLLQSCLSDEAIQNPEIRARCARVLIRAWSDPGMIPLTEKLVRIEGPDTDTGKLLTTALQNQADMLSGQKKYDRSYEVYQLLFDRDPARESWYAYFQLTSRVKGPGAAEMMLQNLEKKLPEGAAKSGVQGLIAEHDGRLAEARQLYADSLKGLPMQPQIRQRLYKLQDNAGLTEEAVKTLEWFFTAVSQGHNEMRSYLAEILTSRGDQRALIHWRLLNSASPGTAYYAVEASRLLMDAGRPDDALALLEDALAQNPHPRLYEMKADIQRRLGHVDLAMETAQEGLTHHADDIPLHRLSAECAESAGLLTSAYPDVCSNVLKSVQRVCDALPGYEPMAHLHGRILEAVGQPEDIERHYRSLLIRNPDHLQSLMSLRHLAVRQGDYDQAEEHSNQLLAGFPRDWNVQRLAAMLEAEQERFHSALLSLQPLSDRSADDAVPVLAYRDITVFDYDGQVNVGQIHAHLTWLAENKRRFITPADLPLERDQRQPAVMVVVMDPSPEVFEQLDGKIQNIPGVTLVCAASPEALIPGPSSFSLYQKLKAGVESGRWVVASSGPDDRSRKACFPDGRLSNPFLHRLSFGLNSETLDEFAERSMRSMSSLTAALPSAGSSGLLVYPGAQAAHMALDIEPAVIRSLEETIHTYFQFAAYSDSAGYLVAGNPGRQIPMRIVPAGWGINQLEDHLMSHNPILQARFDFGKVLYWNRQYERARPVFNSLTNAPFERADVLYNLGASSFREGDLFMARSHLTNGLALDPIHERIPGLLEEVEEEYRPAGSIRWMMWEDNEDRDFDRVDMGADLYVRDWLRLGGHLSRESWRRVGQEAVDGSRYKLPFTWFVADGTWLEGAAWYMNYDNESQAEDMAGADVMLRAPSETLYGYYRLRYTHQHVDTIDAIKADITYDRYMADSYSRLADVWDLFLLGDVTDRSDDNLTGHVQVTLDYRLDEDPFFAPGYRGAYADSDRDPEEYWAPLEVQEHLLYATLRGTRDQYYYSTSLEAGYGREQDYDWEFIWGARGQLSVELNAEAVLHVEGQIFEGPEYERFMLSAGLDLRF